MHIDKQTLIDLEIFKSDENAATLFGLIDKTKTAGGNYCLRQKLINPPDSFDELIKQQETVHFLSESDSGAGIKLLYNTYKMKALEEYISSNISVIENGNLLACSMFCIVDLEAYRYIKNSLKETIEFVNVFYGVVDFNSDRAPFILKSIKEDINKLKNDPDFIEAAGARKNKLRFYNVLRSDRIFRTRLKKVLQGIIGMYYEIDALASMAKTTSEQSFIFPLMKNEDNPTFNVVGLYHPLLQNAVPYNINFDSGSNFVFLTGPNMAGKTTFLKAAGTAVYLAHLGMGIPATSAVISYFDRLVTSLKIRDSIASGYSYFYSEVIRVRQLAESLNQGEKTFSLFDELFRGTNVKDAYDASLMIISGLVRWKKSLFVLSSHLWELGEKIKAFGNIKELCFESEIINGRPFFTYRILQGVSNMRLGMTIIENEKIMKLLYSNENVKN